MATLGDSMKHKRHSRGHGRRFYTATDMSFVKHDAAIKNARVNRGEIKESAEEYVQACACACGCGVEGCFIHGSVTR